MQINLRHPHKRLCKAYGKVSRTVEKTSLERLKTFHDLKHRFPVTRS